MSSGAWCTPREYDAFKAKLVAEDGGRPICYYCRRPIDLRLARSSRESFTIDHLKPKLLFPELRKAITNMVPAHRGCNSSKGTQTAEKTLADMATHRRGTRPEWFR